MKNMTLEHITAACGGTYIGSEENKYMTVRGAVTDSRKAGEGYLFIPVKGERVDGHDFITAVHEQGASATLAEHPLDNCPMPYILVDSTLKALKDIARYYRSQLDIPIIGITGSVGKTSTKEMIASVLSVKYNVLKTDGNFNNEIGLPLTILRIQEEHEAAVVEMGISDFGEMHRLGEISRPDLCVITNIGYCHLENLKDRDGVLKAKTEIFDHLAQGASVILNGDDDKLITVKEVGGKLPVFYGLNQHDIYVEQVENHGLGGCLGLLHTSEGDIRITVPIPGEHNIYNAMAAAAAGLSLGLSLEEIGRGLSQAETIKGRSNLIQAGGITLIDDCYNANPMSMKASLDVLQGGNGRTIAVLGDMGELGEDERRLHYEVGVYAAERGINALFCAGVLSADMAKGARDVCIAKKEVTGKQSWKNEEKKESSVFYSSTRDEMIPRLLEYLREGDTVLVKASHFMNYAKVLEAVKKDREPHD